MKKLLSLALALALCLSLTIPVHAAAELIIENGVLTKCYGPGGSVVIPDGVTAIGEYAFMNNSIMNYGNDALKSVTFPDRMTKIDKGAFQHCDNMTNINIPDGVTEIGEQAFWDCKGLTSFTIPSGVNSIERGTFAYCRSLTSITILGSITKIGDRAFYQSGLTSITIPNSVKTIGESAFGDCTSLTDVTIPGGVTEMGDYAFNGCTSLTNITILDGVTKIGNYAFKDCASLTNVTIPASVTDISEFSAFHVSSENGGAVPIPGLTIHGVAGSYAESYAKAKNIPFAAVGSATPDASAAPEQSAAPASPTKFTDVSPSSPFVDAINWAVEKNITTGKTDTTFAPGEECTNGQILTFLWRANGSPEPTVDSPFTDSIPASFQKAAVWAYEKGLVSGAAFGSSTPCTRAVTVEYLWKAAGSPATSESASFADVPANANYAQAVAWAVANGVTSGTGNGQFSPDNTCTRGQIVTFLYRAMGK